MSRSSDVRFEKDLLQALREPVRSVERNAARARVSRRLQATLSQLEVGAAAALPLLLEAPPVAATQAAGLAAQAKALAAASSGAAAGAASTAGAGIAATAAHPVSVLLTAFALGAGAGGGTLAALSAAHVFEAQVASSSTSAASVNSGAPRSGSRHGSRAIEPAPSEPTSSSELAESGIRAASPSVARAAASRRVPAPDHVSSASGAAIRADAEAGLSLGPHANSLTAQQALLDRARSALARGDGRQALAALSEDARIHPASELSEEREALLIKSLIAAGDSAGARVQAAAFGARYPRSLFLPSIRVALPENP